MNRDPDSGARRETRPLSVGQDVSLSVSDDSVLGQPHVTFQSLVETILNVVLEDHSVLILRFPESSCD